jgi:5-methyltetrahydropteroyltriglutamate--homocysteine methyltransferase
LVSQNATSAIEYFPTQEIGSIAKPSWRVKGVSNDSAISSSDVSEAEKWGRFLEIPDFEELVEILKQRSLSNLPPSGKEKDAIRNWAVKYVLGLFESVNLDRVYSGEQWRVEMYEHLVRNIEGFKLLGSVQSFEYKYYTKAAIVAEPKFVHPIHLEEFQFVKSSTKRRIKLPITGPYTVVDWSFNEFYEKRLRENSSNNGVDLRKIYFEARRDFILSLVKNVLRPEISVLIQNGVDWIQIDEPAITTRPDEEEMELFVEAINELTHGFPDCKFSVHNCYSDYALLAKYSSRLKDIKQLALEFANRDSTYLGTSLEERPGYQDLKLFEAEGYTGEFGLGSVHVHDFSGEAGNGAKVEGRNILESPELVRDRILTASKILKDPARISVNPDCGLRTRSWDVAFQKLRALEEGAVLARNQVS